MQTALAFAIPGGVLAVVLVGAYELLRKRRRKTGGTPVTASYFNEVTAIFYGSKRNELEHQDSVSLMREEQAEGAPPRNGMDLDQGTASLRRPFTR
ncbi:DUF6191 domain-containing protein [Sciscionella marina]|uniref:DUF6191 domain-containing protein n=1 Tax=Sciscionella marina TaxID=508770 RepID=UPI00035CACB0|nr:DUF6191 domain-containing protein [Sciscionella marina]